MALEMVTLAATAVGYIIAGIKKSKGLQTATDEISTAIWEWIKPIFLKEDKKLVEDTENNPDEMKPILEYHIKRLAEENPKFAKELSDIVKNFSLNKRELILKNLKANKDIIALINQDKNSSANIDNIEAGGEIQLKINQKDDK